MNQLVTFDQFSQTNMLGSEPIADGFKKANGEQISFHDIKHQYNYGTTEEPIISDLFLELPKVSATGIRIKEEDTMGKNGPYKKVTHSIMIRFDVVNPENRDENQKAIAALDAVHAGGARILASNKGKLKMFDFDPSRPGAAYKNPVYWPMDEVSGEKAKGKNPNIWLKLRNYKNNRTLFTGLDGKPIDWSLLTDVDIDMIPLLHVEKTYVGANKIASLQVYLQSAIVLNIVRVGTQTRQTSTLERLKAKYGNDLAESVQSQLAEIRMAKQETLVQHATSEFGSSDYGTMHSVVPQAATTTASSSTHTEQASLQDFLSNAPAMSHANPPGPIKLNVMPMKIN